MILLEWLIMLPVVSICLASISLIILVHEFYRYLRLPQIYSLIFTGILYLISGIFESIILFSGSLQLAKVFAVIAVVTYNAGFGTFLLFVESLRSPRISKILLVLVILIPILKFISLVFEPMEVRLEGGIITRQLALTPLNFAPTLILIVLLAYQIADLALKSIKNRRKKEFLKWIFACWIFPMIIVLITYSAAYSIVNETVFTYLQDVFIGLGLSLTALFISTKRTELFIISIDVIGIVISTDTGVLILRETYNELRSPAVELATMLTGVIQVIGGQIDIRSRKGEIIKIDYPEVTYLIFPLGNIVSTLISNGDNSFIRVLLKNLTEELKEKIGDIESIVTDYEINMAKKLICKYFPFVPEPVPTER